MQVETDDQVRARFDSHQLVQVQQIEIHKIREATKELAVLVNGQTREGADARYAAKAISALEEACMWAVKAVSHGN